MTAEVATVAPPPLDDIVELMILIDRLVRAVPTDLPDPLDLVGFGNSDQDYRERLDYAHRLLDELAVAVDLLVVSPEIDGVS